MIVNCLNCEISFDKTASQARRHPNHFCCRSCSATYNNKGKQKNKPITLACKTCSTIYIRTYKHRSKTFCTSCLQEFKTRNMIYRNLTLKEYIEKDSVKNKHSSWKFAHIRILNRNWNKELTKLGCQYCNYSSHVELAHIKAISSWDDNTPLGIINSPDNILVLCPNHHWEFDNNLLKLEQIPNRTNVPGRS